MKNNTFAERVTKLRLKHGLKRDEMAEKLHCSVASIGNYENGHREPDFDTLVTIARLFNTTTDYLLGMTDNITDNVTIKEMCNLTGLSEQAINTLLEFQSENCADDLSKRYIDFDISVLNKLLESDYWIRFFSAPPAYIRELTDIYEELNSYYQLVQKTNIAPEEAADLAEEIDTFTSTIYKKVKTTNCYLYEIQENMNRFIANVYANEIQEKMQSLYTEVYQFERQLWLCNGDRTEESWPEDMYPVLFSQ